MTASTAVPLCLNWTDVIKTRMQTPQAAGCTAAPYTSGFSATARRILAEEGAFALWSTALPASLLRESVAMGTRWGAYGMVKDVLSVVTGDGGSKLASGALLGAVSGLLANPCDLVRIRIQAEAGLADATGTLTTGLRAGLTRQYRHSFHGFAALVSENGVLGLFKGSGINVVRSVCTTVGTVPVYDFTKSTLKTQFGCEDGPRLHFAAGIVTGLVGTTATAPADVLRTRIMAESGAVGIVGAASGVLRDYGPLGFFRGWTPAYIRFGPLMFCMPALVEQVRKRIFGLDYMQ